MEHLESLFLNDSISPTGPELLVQYGGNWRPFKGLKTRSTWPPALAKLWLKTIVESVNGVSPNNNNNNSNNNHINNDNNNHDHNDNNNNTHFAGSTEQIPESLLSLTLFD